MDDDLDTFLAEECQDPETAWIYAYNYGWNDARSLPWWKRLLMRRLSFMRERPWPGTQAKQPGSE